MGDRTLGFNEGEEKTPAGTGQPEEKTPESTDADNLDKELDETLKHEDTVLDEKEIDAGDDTVVLTKAQLEKLKSDKEHYKAGLLSTKEKLKTFKKSNVTPPAKTESDDTRPVTKVELNQKAAISEAEKDEVVNTHWDEIMKCYRNPVGDTSSAAFVKAIKAAKADWLFNEGGQAIVDEEESKKAASKLSGDKQIPAGSGANKGGTPPEKKSVIPKKVPVSEWY
ncbi:MAG: hypothetical protein WC451_06150 [Patescibacteria group bacterium]